MLTVATYFWEPPGDKYHAYTPDDVRALQSMVKRHLSVEHEFAVVTDRPELFDDDADIRAVPINWETHVSGTCFVRLMTFHPKPLIGEWVLQIDLDTLIVGDMDPLVKRGTDLVMWRNPGRVPWRDPEGIGRLRPYYNTSMLLHRSGTMAHLNRLFNPSKPQAKDDQWWLSDKIGPGAPYWDGNDGVYRIGRADTPGSGVVGDLPANAVVVTFPGSEGKAWNPAVAEANPWISQHMAF